MEQQVRRERSKDVETWKVLTPTLLVLKVGKVHSWRRLDCKEFQPVHHRGDQPWIFIGRTDVEDETPILWPPDAKNWLIWRHWCWERLKAGGEGINRGCDGWMASQTQWTWVWVNSRSWWWTGRPGVLQSMGLQRVRHDWVTELKWLKVHSEVWKTFRSEKWKAMKGNVLWSSRKKCSQANILLLAHWNPLWASEL